MRKTTMERIIRAVSADGSTAYEISDSLRLSGRLAGNSLWKQLDKLVRARLLTREPGAPSGNRGRPRAVYKLTPQAAVRLTLEYVREQLELLESTLDIGDQLED